MSPLHLMVDAEALVVAFLKAHAAVAALVAGRVYTALPAAPTWPLVRLERIGGLPLPLGRARHVDRARIQLEAWGRGTTAGSVAGSKGQARLVLETCLAALHAGLPGSHALGVVTAVEPDLGTVWSPDPESDRPRYVAGVLIFTHPNP